LRRPKRRDGIRYLNKPKHLDRAATRDQLEHAAVSPSPYHCPQPNGEPPRRRSKPASHCPDGWTIRRAQICSERPSEHSKLVANGWESSRVTFGIRKWMYGMKLVPATEPQAHTTLIRSKSPDCRPA
jgi:hypothetical protein